ncbi:MAG: ATP-binding protein [Xanthomonadales bacterium]|nr:ATP-binding protein [Xanthomonadales bacterium]
MAGFDFAQSKVDAALIGKLATLTFTEKAENAVLIGGTGKTHLATRD